ncbi:MAG: hypothetical protein J3Q66DRAFT_324723 [Benniella sp.]|nr:MAG: hypothetical protein J3Q66DRAFT_324723 [Benniella sp.]
MLLTTASLTALLALASVATAQDANCSAILSDYGPGVNGKFQKCYTDQVYNKGLVSQGDSPDYEALIRDVCDAKTSGCDDTTLFSATNKYATTCGPSMDQEAIYGNVLQLGKNALQVFFAYPINRAYCAEDPKAPKPSPVLPPAVPPKTYCLASSVTNPSNRFVSNLAIYLTSGSIRSSQTPFFNINNNIPDSDICSPCSQLAMQATISYLSDNLMPKVGPFYTPEFVQYWTKLVPAYNTKCSTTFTQTWPAGTLNVTAPNIPTGSPTEPTVNLPTAASSKAPVPTEKPSSSTIMKPAIGLAALLVSAVALL